MTLTDAARAWVEPVLGCRVVSVAPLTGGVASRMLLLVDATGREVVLRQLVDEPYRRFAGALLTRERDVHGLLAGTAVPAPVTLAVDPGGELAGDPSLLMTRLPGGIDLVASDHADALADSLLAVHAVRPPTGTWPRDYQSWATEEKQRVPPWAADPGAYREAFARLREPPPAHDPVFLHRDFHPGNVLLERGRVTGVVDWVETSTGPADLDVAHCCSHLAGLHGVDAALAFRRAYVDGGGVLARQADAAAYWQLLDLVGFLPDDGGREGGAVPAVLEALWAGQGRHDLTVRTARRRRDELLRAVLA